MTSRKLLWKEIETKLVCIGIPALGLTILLINLPKLNPLSNPILIFFAAINLFADMLAVVLPAGINVSLSYPILICVLLLFGPSATLWVYIPGLLVTQIKRKKEPFKIIFNLTQAAVAVYAASLFLPHDLTHIILKKDIIWLVLTVFIFDFLNFCQVVKVITIQAGGSFIDAFKESWLQEMQTVRPIYYATGIIMATSYQAQGILGALLVIAPVVGAFFQLNTQSKLKDQTALAHTDALTGLSNRLALNSWWQRELPNIVNGSKALSVIMIDIDDFKKVNDKFGHDTGDLVLKSVATTLQECVRSTDCIFRYGGEEFIVLLPDSNADGAKHVAERIRATIDNTKLPHLGNLSVSVSAGLSHLTTRIIEEKDDIAGELVRRADNAMYVAKQNGKNQVQVYH